MKTVISSYWKLFRIIFVMYFLYLSGDILYRWNGFMYYGSFSDFVPGVALISIIWSGIAMFTAMFIWLFIKSVKFLFVRFGWYVKEDYLLIVIYSLLFLAFVLWFGKQPIISYISMPRILKAVIIVLSVLVISWLLRNKLDLIQERITPLVLLYGILLILSIPLLGYHMLGNQSYKEASKKPRHTSSSETPLPNIILVTFDALTARDMSLYGYHRPTTPFIDRWAKNASVFTGAHAASSYTSPTTASLMTGKRVWSHMLYQPHGYMIRNNDTENLPLLLSKAGYYNIALVQNKYTPLKAFSDHFDVVHPMSDFKISNSLTSYIDDGLYKYFAGKIIIYDWVIREDFIFRRFADFLFKFLPDPLRYEYPADKVFSAFLWHIRNEPPQPFFAWLHIFPPHAPYIAPAPYRGMFDSSSKIRTSEKLKGDKSKRFDIARAKYDELIRYCDNEFENFIEKLTEQTKNTVIILSADHGESFEHDFIGHGFYLYEQITNIPLIIKGPDQTEGRIVNGLVEQIDIAPTILEFANIPVAPWMEGRSLLPVIQGKDFPSVPIFSMDLQENHSEEKIQHGVFSVWEDEYKLIHYLDDNKSLLFNLSDDPGEMNNIIDRNAETGKRLLTMIHDNLKKANERISVVD